MTVCDRARATRASRAERPLPGRLAPLALVAAITAALAGCGDALVDDDFDHAGAWQLEAILHEGTSQPVSRIADGMLEVYASCDFDLTTPPCAEARARLDLGAVSRGGAGFALHLDLLQVDGWDMGRTAIRTCLDGQCLEVHFEGVEVFTPEGFTARSDGTFTQVSSESRQPRVAVEASDEPSYVEVEVVPGGTDRLSYGIFQLDALTLTLE